MIGCTSIDLTLRHRIRSHAPALPSRNDLTRRGNDRMRHQRGIRSLPETF
jgi:hypothetical protein